MTYKNIEAQTRGQVAEILPKAIEKAIESYNEFLENVNTGSAKEFRAHHDACKVALAHVVLLLKLAKWAEIPEGDADTQALEEILRKAQKEFEENCR